MTKLPKPNFGIRFLSFLLCLLLFSSMLSSIVIVDLRIITTKENTSQIIRESLFTTHALRPALRHTGSGNGHGMMRAAQPRYAMPKLDEFTQTEDTGIMTDLLVEMFYESMTEEYGELPVTLDDVAQFVEESTLDEELSDISASLISDLVTGENTTVIDAETIAEIVMDNAELIEEYFEVEVDEAAVAEIAESIVENEVVAQIQEEGISKVLLNSLAGDANLAPDGTPINPGNSNSSVSEVTELAQTLESIRSALSTSTMLTCFGAALLWMALLVLLNRKWIWYPLRRIGVTLILSSLPLLIPSIMVTNTNGMVYAMLQAVPMVGPAISLITAMTMPVCVGVAVGGVAFIVAAIVTKILAKKRLENSMVIDYAQSSITQSSTVTFDEVL